MKLVSGNEVLGLMQRVRAEPRAYRQIFLCAPFISPNLLLHITGFGRRVPVSTTVLTNPGTAVELSAVRLAGPFEVTPIPGFHAKIYIACGKEERDSVAIIGSFNFTDFGLNRNFEMGVQITGADCQERDLIKRVEQRLTRILPKKGAIR